MGLFLTRMYKELDRYETAKNRREAFTLPMTDCAVERARKAPWPDHIDVVLADWYEICWFTGQRKSEWAQPDERCMLLGNYHRNLMGDAYACCLTDLRIETKEKQRRSGVRCLDYSASEVQFMWIKYSMQKNGSNGEERMYASGPGGLSFIDCHVSCHSAFQTPSSTERGLGEPSGCTSGIFPCRSCSLCHPKVDYEPYALHCSSGL
jgi:hypothetical protein